MNSCCNEITLDQSNNPEFNKMVMCEWYDGPSSGIVSCDVCMKEYYFYLLDWSNDHSLRAFALKSIPIGTINTFVQLMDETPKWPCWFPSRIRCLKDDKDDCMLIEKIEHLLLAESQPEIVAGWSIRKSMFLCARRISPHAASYVDELLTSESAVAQFDWLDYLGLKRGK